MVHAEFRATSRAWPTLTGYTRLWARRLKGSTSCSPTPAAASSCRSNTSLKNTYERTFATNVGGTLFTVQKALPLLRDGASVVLTGSTTGNKGGISFSVYSASKAAIRNFARSWIQELAPRRIRVNVLAPGATSTPGLHGLFPTDEMHRAGVAMMEAAAPAGRIGSPDEIATAALFLASDDSSFVNGSELFADGGAAQI